MSLDVRMREYERQESGRRFLHFLPICGRVDGRAFHSFTKDMKRPFDERLRAAFVDTMLRLAEETGARTAYHQSDEISFVWYSDTPGSQIWFDGRIMKMTSQLAAQATYWFCDSLRNAFPAEHAERLIARVPTFDARVWMVPDETEAANVFLWREQDATRNSISMAAQALYSHKELFGKSSEEMQEMLHKKGINWNEYPIWAKRGTYVQKVETSRPFTGAELDKLPPLHDARRNPQLHVVRHDYVPIYMPILSTVKNRENVILRGKAPIVANPS